MNVDLVTMLAAYTAVVLTIIGGILSFMLYHFIPMKMRVSTMWHDLYGGNGEGHLEEAEEDRETMRDMLEDAQREHIKQGARVARILRYLRDLSQHLEDDEYHEDPPHIYEDNYVDEEEPGDRNFYRGGQSGDGAD